MLLDRLKQTHSKQQVAYKELEKIVHDGYGYYLKSFVERKDKHLGMFSNGRVIPSSRNRGSNSDIISRFLTQNDSSKRRL